MDNENLPFFRQETGGNYYKNLFNKDLKSLLKNDVDYDGQDKITAHSFRAAIPSHMAQWGFGEQDIKGWGRWNSQAYKKYCKLPVLTRRRLAEKMQQKFEQHLKISHGQAGVKLNILIILIKVQNYCYSLSNLIKHSRTQLTLPNPSPIATSYKICTRLTLSQLYPFRYAGWWPTYNFKRRVSSGKNTAGRLHRPTDKWTGGQCSDANRPPGYGDTIRPS